MKNHRYSWRTLHLSSGVTEIQLWHGSKHLATVKSDPVMAGWKWTAPDIDEYRHDTDDSFWYADTAKHDCLAWVKARRKK